MSETIHHPPHYGGDTTYEAIKVIEAWELNFLIGNTVKYLCRAGKKPGQSPLQDLEKAAWYLARQIEQVKAAELGLSRKSLSSSKESALDELQEQLDKPLDEPKAQSLQKPTSSATPSTSQERKSPSSPGRTQEASVSVGQKIFFGPEYQVPSEYEIVNLFYNTEGQLVIKHP